MQTTLSVIQIVLSLAIILVILLQVKGGGLGGIFGQADSVYRTRRGLEKRLFQLTVVLIITFLTVAIVTLKITQ
jgi:preprotein translocase subunit SecG